MSWKDHRKIDAHVHVLPGERTAQFIANEGPDAPWSQCSAEEYLRQMDRCHIEKALLLPRNDQYMLYQDPYETNRFFAFAGVTASGADFIEQTSRILRAFGPDRLIFGADFPVGSYEGYAAILEQMDFSDEEIDLTAWKNITKLLMPEELE